MFDIKALLPVIRRLHDQIRDAVVTTCEQASLEQMSSVAYEAPDDTIYEIDRVSEAVLLDFFIREVAPTTPIILISEGLEEGQVILPEGTAPEEAMLRIIMDPIDGTRGLMYQKRSAWILTGIAPNRGPETNLQDIEVAVQTEIPLVKQYLSDNLWAIRGEGAQAERYNRLTGEAQPITLVPSKSNTIAHGFAMISRFFPGVRDELAAIDEEIIRAVLGPIQPDKAHCFEDQYISSAGQLYELIAGHDRFVADIRPLMGPILAKRGLTQNISCHPYDLCTELIARELGVIITDIQGDQLKTRLAVHGDVDWVGYANNSLREQIEPALQAALQQRGLLS